MVTPTAASPATRTDVRRGRVLVVQHQDTCPPALVGEWLEAAGLELHVLRPDRGEPVPATLEHDALLVLGGSAGANDDAEHPYLSDVKRLMAASAAAGKPTLGICLGHQLLAVACGGRVRPNDEGQTAGLRQVPPRPGAVTDPLHGAVRDNALAVQWNNDIVVTLPPGARVLSASASGAPLAIRVGERAWGVQFHPEVDASIVATWAEVDVAEGRLTRELADRKLAEIAAAYDELVATWQPWARRFADIVAATGDPD